MYTHTPTQNGVCFVSEQMLKPKSVTTTSHEIWSSWLNFRKFRKGKMPFLFKNSWRLWATETLYCINEDHANHKHYNCNDAHCCNMFLCLFILFCLLCCITISSLSFVCFQLLMYQILRLFNYHHPCTKKLTSLTSHPYSHAGNQIHAQRLSGWWC